tara:strand:- start:682 stop:969 length:288 start_codon:yes stop_codon:yes gene_type:complete
MKPVKKSILKLRKLKEIRRKDLEKNLLDVQLKGQDHYVFIKDNGKAQVVYQEGRWVAEHIRTAVLKFNYEIDKTEKMLVREFEDKYLNEYEKTLQ